MIVKQDVVQNLGPTIVMSDWIRFDPKDTTLKNLVTGLSARGLTHTTTRAGGPGEYTISEVRLHGSSEIFALCMHKNSDETNDNDLWMLATFFVTELVLEKPNV